MTHEILGARARIEDPQEIVDRAQKWAAERGGEVLLADAACVFGRDHLESAVLHARRAKAAGTNAARSLGLETLRYLTGQRQVADAIRAAGLKRGIERIAIVAFEIRGTDMIQFLGWTRDDRVLDQVGKDLKGLGMTKRETGTVPASRTADLALERVALLDIEK